VNNRPAFLDALVMIGVALIGMAAFLVVLGMFTMTIVPTIPDILTDVPILYDYNGTGHKILTIADLGMTKTEMQARIDEIKLEISHIEDAMILEVKNKRFGAYNDLEEEEKH